MVNIQKSGCFQNINSKSEKKTINPVKEECMEESLSLQNACEYG